MLKIVRNFAIKYSFTLIVFPYLNSGNFLIVYIHNLLLFCFYYVFEFHHKSLKYLH